MAKNIVKVWLGFEDEYITEKNKSHVNFTTNKIGGLPVSNSRIEMRRLKFKLTYFIIFRIIRTT